jgi:hypothetical protein
LHDGAEACECLPRPAAVHLSAEDTVPDLRQRGVLIADKAIERRLRAIEHEQPRDARANGDSAAFAGGSLNI